MYEKVCNATKLIPQRAIMGANFLNFRAHELYTMNGNKISETFVKWDNEKKISVCRVCSEWKKCWCG